MVERRGPSGARLVEDGWTFAGSSPEHLIFERRQPVNWPLLVICMIAFWPGAVIYAAIWASRREITVVPVDVPYVDPDAVRAR